MSRIIELRVPFLPDGLDNQLLGVVEIGNDEARRSDEHINRRITAAVQRRGPIWERFVSFWSRTAQLIDGVPFLYVRGLQVEHDFYPFTSYINVSDFPTIRLLVAERFAEGTVAEYFEMVRDRNRSVQLYHDAWQDPRMTGNDFRELTGYPRRGEPHLNEPLSEEKIAEMRAAFFTKGPWRNMIAGDWGRPSRGTRHY